MAWGFFVAGEFMQAPFPYFGGKSAIADVVWRYFGDVPNYVEPFFGSGAMLLSRPHQPGTETVNDANGFISNFWRAIAADPDIVAQYADWPVTENDLHARHVWLIQQKPSMQSRLEGDPEWYDAKIAGWWVWGICNWIGGQWCDDKAGPWWVEDGRLVHLGNASKGVSRQRVHLGDAGQGVSRQRVHLKQWFHDLSDRLRRVRVCCGDWSRVMGRSVTANPNHGVTAVFLDPPYLHEVDGKNRYTRCYGQNDCGSVARDVAEWCRKNGDDPKLRIVLCGYESEHEMLGWTVRHWKTRGGMASQFSNGSANAARERLWISPHCLRESLLFAK